MQLSLGGTDLVGGFTAAMERLGPFGSLPRIAAAVSGGADSMALALLADAWVRARGGALLGLVVDHGLRATSGAEAIQTIERLARYGIRARLLTLTGLVAGSALAERARVARYQILLAACAAEGILHLLVGHHAADQAETVMMRALGNSGSRGLAAMPALFEAAHVRLLRPMLGLQPTRLRAMLRAAAVDWVEDPSNSDIRALRARLRGSAATYDGDASLVLAAACRAAGWERAADDRRTARWLADNAEIRPEGFALLPVGPVPPAALAALIQTITGAAYPPASDAISDIAARPRPVTLAGARLMHAGRLGAGLILAREEAAMMPAVPAQPGIVWDNRFRLICGSGVPEGAIPDEAIIGPLGSDAARFRRRSSLPSSVLRTLPAIRRGNSLAAVPHLVYPDLITCACLRLVFSPSRPLAGAPFLSL